MRAGFASGYGTATLTPAAVRRTASLVAAGGVADWARLSRLPAACQVDILMLPPELGNLC